MFANQNVFLLCLFSCNLMKTNDLPGPSSGQYAVAQFENNVVSVIPVKWIFKTDGQLFCHWTCSRQRIMLNEMPNKNWPVWPIVRIMARRGNCEN